MAQYPKLKAILFDLDGTLVATANRWSEKFARRLQPLTHIFPQFRAQHTAKRLLNTLEFATTYGMLWLEHLGIGSGFFGLADRIRRSKGLATRAASALIPGSEELLQTLAQHYRIAVVTTRQYKEAEAFLVSADIKRHFEVIITRRDAWFIKPHPAPVRRAVQTLGLTPGECLMVGDTMLDIRSARRAGVRAVGVLTGYDDREELMQAGAETVLCSAAELVAYLEQ